MRFVSFCALLATTTALSGCAGGDGSALSLATSGVDICGITDPNCATASTTGTASGTGGSTGGGTGGGTTTPPTPVVTGTTAFANGNATIILEKSVLVNKKATPALARTTFTTAPTSTAKFLTNITSTTTGSWPESLTMTEYDFGTAASGGLGLGGDYKEYRELTDTTDEELQVWTWRHSAGIQYRDVPAGGEALHQAWSFQSKSALAADAKSNATQISTGGNVNFNGQYGATAKTWGWLDPSNPSQTLSRNGIWQVNGTASINGDLSTGNITGTLSPTAWIGWQTLNPNPLDPTTTGRRLVLATDTANANFASFMNDSILISGAITSGTTGNSIVGSAVMDPTLGWVTGSGINPMYGAVFGAAADEITGVFNLKAVSPEPVGGTFPINDDRRGYIQQSGVFNVQR